MTALRRSTVLVVRRSDAVAWRRGPRRASTERRPGRGAGSRRAAGVRARHDRRGDARGASRAAVRLRRPRTPSGTRSRPTRAARCSSRSTPRATSTPTVDVFERAALAGDARRLRAHEPARRGHARDRRRRRTRLPGPRRARAPTRPTTASRCASCVPDEPGELPGRAPAAQGRARRGRPVRQPRRRLGDQGHAAGPHVPASTSSSSGRPLRDGRALRRRGLRRRRPRAPPPLRRPHRLRAARAAAPTACSSARRAPRATGCPTGCASDSRERGRHGAGLRLANDVRVRGRAARQRARRHRSLPVHDRAAERAAAEARHEQGRSICG